MLACKARKKDKSTTFCPYTVVPSAPSPPLAKPALGCLRLVLEDALPLGYSSTDLDSLPIYRTEEPQEMTGIVQGSFLP